MSVWRYFIIIFSLFIYTKWYLFLISKLQRMFVAFEAKDPISLFRYCRQHMLILTEKLFICFYNLFIHINRSWMCMFLVYWDHMLKMMFEDQIHTLSQKKHIINIHNLYFKNKIKKSSERERESYYQTSLQLSIQSMSLLHSATAWILFHLTEKHSKDMIIPVKNNIYQPIFSRSYSLTSVEVHFHYLFLKVAAVAVDVACLRLLPH